MKKFLSKSMVGCLLIAGVVHGIVGCAEEDRDGRRDEAVEPARTVSDEELLAKVDGVPITLSDVRDYLEEVDDEIGPREAFQRLLEQELLAREARRRGYAGHADVLDEQSKALARVLLANSIEDGTTGETIDQDKLRRYYKSKKVQYVHGLQRRTSHLLVPTGKKKGATDEEAHAAAMEMARAAQLVTDLEGFKALAKQFGESDDLKVKYEVLPPFDKDSTGFVREFVDAAFAVPRVQMAGEAFKTKFGWHVLYVIEEIPPLNRSFEEVKDELIAEVLPAEKRLRYKRLIKSLQEKSRVVIVEGDVTGE